MNILPLIILMGLFPLPAIASTTPSIGPNLVITAPLSIKDKIIDTFNDYRMVAVLGCESQWRQFRGTSTPLLSITSDVGIAQINQVHWKEAKKLGLDIFNSQEDNLKMAKHIYDTQGITAWNCYNKLYGKNM